MTSRSKGRSYKINFQNVLKDYVPTEWSTKTEINEIILSPDSEEYESVLELLSGKPLENLTMITRVENPYLYALYKLRQEELERQKADFDEITLLHVTAAKNIPSIITTNLDWRLVKRHKYGFGVSFSQHARYANKECNKAIGPNRAVVVCDVLVAQELQGEDRVKITQLGDVTIGGSNQVFVKYYDYEFYPTHIVYYNNEGPEIPSKKNKNRKKNKNNQNTL